MLMKCSQQAPDVYVTSGWRWTWRQTDVAFWLKMKIGLTPIWRWLNVGFWLHNLKTTTSQGQLTSVLDINLTLTLDVGFTLDFGHPTSQPKFNQISTSYDVVCLFCACWVCNEMVKCFIYIYIYIYRMCHIFEAWSGLIWLYLQVFLFDEQQLRLRRLYISSHREHSVQEISL